MALPLIIQGAVYKSGNVLLRPHYSGEFNLVDCTEYKTKKEILKNYDKKYATEFLDGFYLTHEGIHYYECNYYPHNTNDFELLSDLSQIKFYDNETDF